MDYSTRPIYMDICRYIYKPIVQETLLSRYDVSGVGVLFSLFHSSSRADFAMYTSAFFEPFPGTTLASDQKLPVSWPTNRSTIMLVRANFAAAISFLQDMKRALNFRFGLEDLYLWRPTSSPGLVGLELRLARISTRPTKPRLRTTITDSRIWNKTPHAKQYHIGTLRLQIFW